MITSFRGEYRFLSNFWPAKVIYEDIEFSTVEHAYVASKAIPGSAELYKAIIAIETPGKVKRLGRKFTLRPDWHKVKYDLMKDLVFQKFEHKELKKLLLETEDHWLIEGNTWGDKIWGAVQNEKTKEWEGNNWLGEILMSKRSQLNGEYFF